MSGLLGYVTSVGGFALLSLLGVAWMGTRPRSTAARRAVAAIVIAYAAASIRMVPWLLSRPLVYGFHEFRAADAPVGSAAIVLLGGGTFTIHGPFQRLSFLDLDSAARVLEAAHVYRMFDTAWIISSGGASAGFELEPSAATMRDALVRLGIPANRIVLESTSTSTRDEAVLVAPILQTLHADHVVLVTTDIHMRRALAAFRAAGVDALPAFSQDPLKSQSRLRSIMPTTEGLQFTRDVTHEYAGLLEYVMHGWLRF